MADENTIDYPALCEELSARVAELEVALTATEGQTMYPDTSRHGPYSPYRPSGRSSPSESDTRDTFASHSASAHHLDAVEHVGVVGAEGPYDRLG